MSDSNPGYYQFDCGCKVPILDEEIKDYDGLPSLHIPYDQMVTDLNYGKVCPATWEIFAKGYTKGVFQLETHLGQNWSEKLQPESIEEISALVSLIRPGCLRAIVDGKSMTTHYVDRKQGNEEITYFHKALEPILNETYGVMTYQEQAMRIAVSLAGFNEQEADVLRKAIGKKKADIMASLKDKFVKGCETVGYVSKEEAEEIFAWIQESQRYSFNKSHGVSYGVLGYLSAWVKHHFPMHFYCSWIVHARDKQDTQTEVKELISDAKIFDISVNAPSLSTLSYNNADVCIHDSNIYFGVRCIKKIGEAATEKLLLKVAEMEAELGKKVSEFSWMEFLFHIADKVTKTTINNLISVGVLSKFQMSRQRMLFEYELFRSFSPKEKKLLKERLSEIPNLEEAMKEAYILTTKARQKKIQDMLKLIQEPPKSLKDKPGWILTQEKNLLGTPLSYHMVDTIDSNFSPDTTCKEFRMGKTGDMTMAVEVIACRPYTIPRGNSKGNVMGFLTIEDATGQIDAVAFSNVWEEHSDELQKGCTVALKGTKSNKGSFQIDVVHTI